MYGYNREKFHVNHFWELKGYALNNNDHNYNGLVLNPGVTLSKVLET